MEEGRETQIYEFIVKYVKEHLYGPTIKEICENTGLRSNSSVFVYLKRLHMSGRIEVQDYGSRTIKLTGYKLTNAGRDEEKATELQELMCDKYCRHSYCCNSQEELNEHCDNCELIDIWNFIINRGCENLERNKK